MKRLVAIFALIAVIFCLAACSSEQEESSASPKHHEMITDATKELKKYWEQEYQKMSGDITTDGYFEIKNTRVITLKENDSDFFRDVSYIIEYELYTDYMGTAPYYENCAIYNNVVVYKDGSMEVTSNFIRTYRSKTYQTDYTDFIETIDDYCDQYNCTKHLQ